MNSEGVSYNNVLPALQRRPQYGEVDLSYEPHDDAEVQHLDRGTHWTLALVIFTPLLAAYGAIGYGLYLAADGLL